MSNGLYSDLEELIKMRFHVKQRKLAHQQWVQSQLGGNHHAVRKGRGMEFSEVRKYQPGDDIRHIDWRVSARTQKVHTKLFVEELELPVVCVIEQTPNLFFGSHVRFKTTQALNLLALLGWATLNQQDRFGCLSFNHLGHHWAEPKHQPKTLMQIFHQTIELQAQLQQPGEQAPQLWTEQFNHLQKHIRPGTKLFLIGDCLQWQASHFGQLQTLKRHCDLTAIHLYDRLETELPSIGLAKLSNGQTDIQINASEQKVLAQYHKQYQQSLQTLKESLGKLRIPLIPIAAQENPLEALIMQGILR